ncbi:MAG TPA: hypothetical protein VF595_17550 [Tepidisphaeraceae bacterium]|jgi:serine acetyltransferase
MKSLSSSHPPERLHVHERLWEVSRDLHRRGWLRTARIIKAVNFYLHTTLLPAEAVVGRNIRVEHYGVGVVIHPNTVIGDNVTIWHGVTIAGQSWIGSGLGVVIEDDVMIGTHAIIMPKSHTTLTIGKGARVAAGAVVTKNVPAGTTCFGHRPTKPTDAPVASASVATADAAGASL